MLEAGQHLAVDREFSDVGGKLPAGYRHESLFDVHRFRLGIQPLLVRSSLRETRLGLVVYFQNAFTRFCLSFCVSAVGLLG